MRSVAFPLLFLSLSFWTCPAEAAALSPEEVAEKIAEIRSLMQLSQREAAGSLLEETLRQTVTGPSQSKLLILKGVLLYHDRKRDEADKIWEGVEYYESQFDNSRLGSLAAEWRGYGHATQGKLIEAGMDFERVYRQTRERGRDLDIAALADVDRAWGRGWNARSSQKRLDVVPELRALGEKFAEFPEAAGMAWYSAGWLSWLEQRYEDAAQDFRRVPPDLVSDRLRGAPEAGLKQAECLFYLGRMEEAQEVLSKWRERWEGRHFLTGRVHYLSSILEFDVQPWQEYLAQTEQAQGGRPTSEQIILRLAAGQRSEACQLLASPQLEPTEQPWASYFLSLLTTLEGEPFPAGEGAVEEIGTPVEALKMAYMTSERARVGGALQTGRTIEEAVLDRLFLPLPPTWQAEGVLREQEEALWRILRRVVVRKNPCWPREIMQEIVEAGREAFLAVAKDPLPPETLKAADDFAETLVSKLPAGPTPGDVAYAAAFVAWRVQELRNFRERSAIQARNLALFQNLLDWAVEMCVPEKGGALEAREEAERASLERMQRLRRGVGDPWSLRLAQPVEEKAIETIKEVVKRTYESEEEKRIDHLMDGVYQEFVRVTREPAVPPELGDLQKEVTAWMPAWADPGRQKRSASRAGGDQQVCDALLAVADLLRGVGFRLSGR